jgi:hypothetical protein
MKPAPAPNVPGNTEWERFDNAVSMVLAVPKKAFLKEEAGRKAKRRRKQAKVKSSAKG